MYGEMKVKYITSNLHSINWRHKPQEKKKMNTPTEKSWDRTIKADRVANRAKMVKERRIARVARLTA